MPPDFFLPGSDWHDIRLPPAPCPYCGEPIDSYRDRHGYYQVCDHYCSAYRTLGDDRLVRRQRRAIAALKDRCDREMASGNLSDTGGTRDLQRLLRC